VVTEEASRLHSSNTKLSQDLEGKSDDPPVLAYLSACFLSRLDLMTLDAGSHYVKTSNRSRNICNGPLTLVTSTHICNGCCLAPVTYKRVRTTPGLASTTPVTNVDFW
jgi:hypothetical protein